MELLNLMLKGGEEQQLIERWTKKKQKKHTNKPELV